MMPGCAVEGWTISIGSGPGRANSKINVEFHGSGKLTEPSAITMPAATVEKLLPSVSLTLTINGVDYVTRKHTGWLASDGGQHAAVRVPGAHDQWRRLRHE